MSPFAAGCAICGADLDHRRWDSGPGPLTRAGSRISALGYGPQRGKMSGLLVLVLVFFGGSIVASLGAAIVYLL